MKIKTIALLLCLTIITGLSAACASEIEDDPTAQTDSGTAAETEPGEEPGEFVKDSIPGTLRFDGQTITILHWSDRMDEEFTVADQTGEPVNDAIWNRNRTVEERLGIKLEFLGEKGDAVNKANFESMVSRNIQAGAFEFEIVAAHSFTMGLVASRNLLYNLNETEWIDLTKPWYPIGLTGEATINNKLYFVSGDMSGNLLSMMYCVYFNKLMIDKYDLEDPYKVVDRGDWTTEKMIEMSTNIYDDLNGNNNKDTNDQFGFILGHNHCDGTFAGAGFSIAGKDANDNLVPSEALFSERFFTWIDLYNSFLYNTNDGLHVKKNHEEAVTAFNEGRALFVKDNTQRATRSRFINSEQLVYGVLPSVKLDKNQQNYITGLGNPYTLYGIREDVAPERADLLSAVLEVYASESYRQLSPAIFELTFKTKRANDPDSVRMFDIIRENVVFDLGQVFSQSIPGMFGRGDFTKQVNEHLDTWASTSASMQSAQELAMKNLMKVFE